MFRRMGVWGLALVVILAAVASASYAGTMEKSTGSMMEKPMGTMEKGATAESMVNINQADAQQLASLPGIGETIAQAIVEYRDKNGPFRKVEDLMEVKGIGEKKLAAIRDMVTLK